MTTMGAAAGRTDQALQGGVTPEIDRLHAALRRSPIALHVQRLVPLTKGSQLKRYEVLLRSKSENAPNSAPQAMLKAAVENGLGSMIDRRVVTELIGYLVHHPEVWKTTAVMFSVNLTTTALHDEHFIKFIELCLAKSVTAERNDRLRSRYRDGGQARRQDGGSRRLAASPRLPLGSR